MFILLLFQLAASPMQLPDRTEALGKTRERLEQACNRLGAAPLDDLDFVLADINLQMVRRFTNYSGDISGRMLGALNSAGAVLGRDAAFARRLASELHKFQNPDGHFGADQDLSKQVNQERDMALLWGNGRLLLALAEQLRSGSDQGLMTIARRLGDYLVSTRPYYGREANFTTVGGDKASGYTTCYPSLIDGLAALGQVAADTRYTEEARFIARLSLLDSEHSGHHSHGRLTAYRGMLDLDRFTRTTEFRPRVREGIETILGKYVLPTGGISEYFDRSFNRDEGCSDADWVRVNFLLWQATGDTKYLDVAEHGLLNHLLALQFPNGGFGHWTFRPLEQGAGKFEYGALSNTGSESYWCCSMHGTQLLADTARWTIVRRNNELFVTWLGEASATFGQGPEAFTVAARHVGRDSWSVSIAGNAPPDTSLNLRVPLWAQSIKVDGEERKPQSGWVTLRPVVSGQSVQVRLPDELRFEGAYGTSVIASSPVRVFSGSEMYCLPETSIGPRLVRPDAVPTLALATLRPEGSRIPVLIKADKGRFQRAYLVPLAERPRGGARYMFSVERVTPDAFASLSAHSLPSPRPGIPVELEFAADAQCEVYLNGRRMAAGIGREEAGQVEAFTDIAQNVVALKVRGKGSRPGVIGQIRINGRRLVTGTAGWSAVPWDPASGEACLTDMSKGTAVPVVDLGSFGVAPWQRVAADFAGTGAHWIWPVVPRGKENDWWLLRYRFGK